MNAPPRQTIRWTEDELRLEIHRIGDLLEQAAGQRDPRSRCAASYLSQLLRDRQDVLATLRARKRRLS